MLADLERARDALHAIPPDLPRDEWVRAGMAAHAAGLPFDDFDAWSAGGGTYDARAAREVWRSFKSGKGIEAGTLFKMAKDSGWRPADRPGRVRPAKAPQRPAERTKAPRLGMSAAEVWKRLEPAPASHGYIEAKQGIPDGLRVVPEGDPLRIAGQAVAGWLAVPVVPLNGGEPVSVQFTPPPGGGKKLNLPGARVDGVFIVGKLSPAGTAYLCEGIGQAWAIWKATGAASVVCFGWGRVRAVAAELRKRDASARLVLVPDVGKESEAETIARELALQFVVMPDGWPANADVNDYAQREGFDALEALLSAPEMPGQRFRLWSASDLYALPPLAWCVRGVLPKTGIGAFFGPSGSGKSFLAFDACAAIADGVPWFGYKVTPAPVVYCALEGEAGFRLRLAAWESAKGRRVPAGLRLVLQPFKLTEPQDVADMSAAALTAGPGPVVIIDTLNRAAPEADENASADMGRIIQSAKDLQRLTGGLVLLVHHSGKDASRGLRGHSSLFAALDAAVEVSREGDRREWRVAKAKDGQDGAGHPFRLQVVELGKDHEGEALTSCAVLADQTPQALTRCPLPKGGNQKVVLDALNELMRKSGTFGKGGAPAVRPCVQLEAAVDSIAPRLTCEPKRQKERTRHALASLHGSGVVTCREGWLWLP